jgi:hypothetical protein
LSGNNFSNSATFPLLFLLLHSSGLAIAGQSMDDPVNFTFGAGLASDSVALLTGFDPILQYRCSKQKEDTYNVDKKHFTNSLVITTSAQNE